MMNKHIQIQVIKPVDQTASGNEEATTTQR